MSLFDNIDHALRFSLNDNNAKPSSIHRNRWSSKSQERAEERLTVIILVNMLDFPEKFALYCRYGNFLDDKNNVAYKQSRAIFIDFEEGLKEQLMLKYFRKSGKKFGDIAREGNLSNARVSQIFSEIKDKISPIEMNATLIIEEKLIKAGLIEDYLGGSVEIRASSTAISSCSVISL